MIKYVVKYTPDNGETFAHVDVDAKNYTSAYMDTICKLPKGAMITEVLATPPRPAATNDYAHLSLGDTLRQARLEQDWTTRQLAEIVGISHMTIHNYETEQSEPRISHLKWLAEALGLSLFDLVQKV